MCPGTGQGVDSPATSPQTLVIPSGLDRKEEKDINYMKRISNKTRSRVLVQKLTPLYVDSV